ncbi:MAG TPA: glutamine-hydrolyzing carbamoyl-phosphate synthase small subunit [Nitrospirales bacterium]|nr:glutamine-hydrolyzing carbamoyl-phosphate synthase small subunit [Nitrospirales bacterium]
MGTVKPALLALEDGTVFRGTALGAPGETVGEVVFNTALSGYQEILTDPSYRGQMVTMTYPHIGNYGINPEDIESRQPWLAGYIVKEACPYPSNWRSRLSLGEYLRTHGIVGIQGLDTRALTTHLRDHGSQQGCISHGDLDPDRVIKQACEAPGILGRDLVQDVTCAKPYEWTEGSGQWKVGAGGASRVPVAPEHATGGGAPSRARVVAFDFGIKYNILRRLVDEGCAVTVVPASATADEVLALNPDGIFLSNGPGDPEAVPYAVETVRRLLGKRPVFGICLGHQIMGLALGLFTYKLKFGHHGANHPVLDLATRKVEITSQNHNFAVRVGEHAEKDARGTACDTPFGRVRVSHVSLNDEAVEGLECLDLSAFSVQYHPEASPGPHDAAYHFRRFTNLMAKGSL